MGCCASHPVDDDGTTPANIQGRPFRRAGLKWTSNTPMTRHQLEQQRTTFWETAPSYEGRPEIWQALEAAITSSDLALSQSILDAANIILPTGNPAEGCYDELGNRYVIPMYCLVDPSNLVEEQEEPTNIQDTAEMTTPGSVQAHTPTMTDDGPASILHKSSPTSTSVLASSDVGLMEEKEGDRATPHLEQSGLIPITVRLSIVKDIKLFISPTEETSASLKKRIFMDKSVPISPETHTIRLIFLGRVLKDQDRIVYHNDSDAPPKSTSNTVFISKDAVIQALIAKI